MGISAIVVTYNRVQILKKCIRCLLNQSYKLDNIFIINNNSTDDTKNYLSRVSVYKRIIKPINTHKNLGGAGGFSFGIKMAYEQSQSSYFWIMDDDTAPTKNALNNLAQSAKRLHGRFGFLCSNVRWWKDLKPCNIPEVSKMDWDTLLPGNLIKIKKATFVSYMFSRKAVTQLGLPIKQMFIWGDDVEYSLRLDKYYPSYFVSNSVVIHNSLSSPRISMFNMAPNRDKYLQYDFRNELYAYRKNSNTKSIAIEILKDIFFIVRIPFLSKKRRLRKLYYTISGFIKGFFFNPKIEFPSNMNDKRG